MSISQSVECPLTLKDTMVVGGNLDTRNGIGQGMFSVVWRRLISQKGWSEVRSWYFQHFFLLCDNNADSFDLL